MLDIKHIADGSKRMAWIMNLESHPNMFENLKVGKMLGAKHAVKLRP
jgi:hypothetical protein